MYHCCKKFKIYDVIIMLTRRKLPDNDGCHGEPGTPASWRDGFHVQVRAEGEQDQEPAESERGGWEPDGDRAIEERTG